MEAERNGIQNRRHTYHENLCSSLNRLFSHDWNRDGADAGRFLFNYRHHKIHQAQEAQEAQHGAEQHHHARPVEQLRSFEVVLVPVVGRVARRGRSPLIFDILRQ